MTAQTHATEASGAAVLLASLPTNPPQSPASPQQDFLTIIARALAGMVDEPDSPPTGDSTAPAPARQKTVPAATGDPAASSLLLALLTPLPQMCPFLPNPSARKASAASVPFVPSVPLVPAQSANSSHSKALTLPKSPADADSNATPPAVKPLAVESQAAAAVTEPKQEAPAISDAPDAPDKGARQTAVPDGTSVAVSSPRMSLTAQKNENAGSTEQNLPPASSSAVAAIAGGSVPSQGGAKSSLRFAWHNAPSEELPVTDVSAKAAAPAPSAPSAAAAPAASTAALQVDRLEQYISRLAVTIRQSGVGTLEVMLKVDSNTHLFLQLINHNGQVQATLRCDRGDFSALDPQWAQLQQSLARQNVQLVPLAGSSTLSGFQPPPDQSQRQPAPPREDGTPAAPVVKPAQDRQQKNQNRSRRSWEFWA